MLYGQGGAGQALAVLNLHLAAVTEAAHQPLGLGNIGHAGQQGEATKCPATCRCVKSPSMSQRIRACLLLIAMVWQSLGLASPLAVAEQLEHWVHGSLHVQIADHHHHADESVHLEDSASAASHHHTDGGINPAGLLVTGWPGVAAFKAGSPAEGVAVEIAEPLLAGLLRPPRPRLAESLALALV